WRIDGFVCKFMVKPRSIALHFPLRAYSTTPAALLRDMIKGDSEDVVVPHLAFARPVQPAVHDQWNLLFGKAAMRTQRLCQARQIMPCRAGSQQLVTRRQYDNVANSVRGELKAGTGIGAYEHEVDTLDSAKARGQRAGVGVRRQIDCGKGSKRSMMSDIR